MAFCDKNCECLYKLLELKKPQDTIQVLKSSIIKAQYRKLMLLIHPDKTNDPRSHITAILLNQALAILGDRAVELDYRLNGLAFVNNHKHTLDESATAIQFLSESQKNHVEDSRENRDKINNSDLVARRRSHRIQNRLERANKESSDGSETSKSCNTSITKSPSLRLTTKAVPSVSKQLKTFDENSSLVNLNNTQASKFKFKQQSSLVTNETRSTESTLNKLSKLWILKYRAQNSRRDIARIVDHNIRPEQVYFIAEWSKDKSQDLIKAETLVCDNDHRVKLYAYLERVRLNAPNRFDYLVKKAPVLWDLYDMS